MLELVLALLLFLVLPSGPALSADVTHLEAIPDRVAFELVSRPSRTRSDIVRTAKFLTPISGVGALPTVYQNVNEFPFHLDFMAAVFPEEFPALTLDEYRRIVERRASRRYFAGSISEIRTPGGDTVYGVDFYTDPAEASELPTPDEAAGVVSDLARTFALDPIVYAPLRTDVVAHAREWIDPPVPVYLPDGGDGARFAIYTQGINYGRIRSYALADLIAASEDGLLSPQDVVVVDEAPIDLTSPVAAVITGTAQTELSHLTLRLAQRGTPNAWAPEVVERAASLEGVLVRVEMGDARVEIAEVENVEEAEDWWSEHRPRLPEIPGSDVEDTTLRALDELRELPDAVSRYGAKAANLALLGGVLPPENVATGFAVPFAWYERFLDESRLFDPAGGDLVSYREYTARLLADDRFRTDSVHRAGILDDLWDTARRSGFVAEELREEVRGLIVRSFGGPERKARFRSSSNFEDIVPFNGAGLYESTGGCVADDLDGDGRGPSLCDPEEEDERTTDRALRRVWASLWLARAFNERDYWQAPHDAAKMGVLVSEAFSRELANGVVLSGNPSAPGDDRIVINVQVGEESVVHPDPSVLPEKILVEMDGGEATLVDRVRPSSLSADGEWILSIEEAREIGRLVAIAHEQLAPRYATELGEIILDLEFKVVADGDARRIVFKQVRPFLRGDADDAPRFRVTVPEEITLCGSFQEFRTLDEERALSTTLRLSAGEFSLPARAGRETADMVAEIVLGPDRAANVAPTGPGYFETELVPDRERTLVSTVFHQSFDRDGEALELELRLPVTTLEEIAEAGPELVEVRLDELAFTWDVRATGALEGGPLIAWTSCEYSTMPEYRFSFEATTGERVELLTRHQPPFAGTGPERLRRAEVRLGTDPQTVDDDYWRLVYSADHHNWNRRFRVHLDPAVGEVSIVELHEPGTAPRGPARFLLLDAAGELLRELEIAGFERDRLQSDTDPEFIRGDANGDGRVDVADPLRVLSALFLGGQPVPCDDAADTNDDGRVDVTDIVRTLLYVFVDETGRFEPPWPGPWQCGRDLGPDDLPTCGFDIDLCLE